MKRMKTLTADEVFFEIKAQEYERGLKDAMPKVTKEFVERWSQAMARYFIPPRDLSGFINAEQAIKQMLKEAGVKVEE